MIGDKIEAFLADKGYDADAIRDELAQAEVEAVVPAKDSRKSPVPHDREKYRWRYLVERLLNKLQNWRGSRPDTTKSKKPNLASPRSPQLKCEYPLSKTPKLHSFRIGNEKWH